MSFLPRVEAMKKREYTTPEQKREIMLAAGVEPLEEFEHKDKPWRSRCLTCQREVSPRFGSVRQGQGGCKFCAGVALDVKEAKKLIEEAGLEPLEEYVNSRTPWRAKCKRCGSEVSPTLGNIKWRDSGCNNCGVQSRAKKRMLPTQVILDSLAQVGLVPVGQLEYLGSKKGLPVRCKNCERLITKSLSVVRRGSGCPYCSKKRVDPKDAKRLMRDNGAKPLEDYKSSSAPWRCLCLTCEREITPTYDSVRSGQSACAFCSGKRIDLLDAMKLMKDKKLLPLVPYPGSGNPWPSLCITCGRETRPSLSNLKSGHGGCLNCAGKFVDPENASELMLKAGLKPLKPYVSRHTPWLSLCLNCSREVSPTYGSVSRGSGCKFCADVGIDYTAEGYLYLITHLGMLSHKIGIANTNPRKRYYNRISQHESKGWIVIKRYDFPTAEIAYNLEQRFLDWVRDVLGLGIYLSQEEMPQGGYTETFSGYEPIEIFARKLEEIVSGETSTAPKGV